MPVRVFWPVDAIEHYTNFEQGIVVGWQNTPKDFVVVSVLHKVPVDLLRDLLHKKALLSGNKDIDDLYKRYQGSKLEVLGTLNHVQDDTYFSANVSRNGIQLIFQNESQPATLILYTPPKTKWLHYLSVDPIPLDYCCGVGIHDSEALAQREKMRHSIELHALNILHPQPGLDLRRCQSKVALFKTISEINASRELNELLQTNAEKKFPLALENYRKRRKSQSRARRLSVSAQAIGEQATKTLLSPLLSLRALLVFTTVGLRYLMEYVLIIINYNITPSISLRSFLHSAQRLDLMLQRFCHIPSQLCVLKNRSKIWPTPEYNLEYIRVCNHIWLEINDRILGYLVGHLILTWCNEITSLLVFICQVVLGEQFQRFVVWLMSFPAGLKLNSELASFIGQILLWIIITWKLVLRSVAPHFAVVCHVVASVGVYGGLSLQISMVMDMLALMTLHVKWFYLFMAKVYRQQFLVLSSLFRLFRGKNYNPLRVRIDNGDYDIDQLLLGTIFFTVLLFLLPTVVVLYAAMSFTQLLVVLVTVVLELALLLLNHMPLFALMLRLKSPGRMPGGLLFVQKTNIGQTVLELKSEPVTLSHIFRHMFAMRARLQQNYLSVKVFKGLLTGTLPVRRLKVQAPVYAMLPQQPVSVKELRLQLLRAFDLERVVS